MTQFGDIAERLDRVRQQIVDAGGTDVEILAVTKGHPPEQHMARVIAEVKDVGRMQPAHHERG